MESGLLLGHVVSKSGLKVDLDKVKALTRMQLQVGFPTSLKGLLQEFEMVWFGAEHRKVIDEHFQEMSQEVLKNIHHQPLKGSGCVAKTKRHPVEGEGPPLRSESGLQLILRSDEHLVVTGKPVQEAIAFMTGNMV